MKRLPVVYGTDRSGHSYWRSLGEREASPAFREALEREFPDGASQIEPGMSRRKAMSLMGAALALGGLTACRKPEERILPYARPPEEIVPGKPLHFATAVSLYGTAFGLLVESHEGRPTKIEGNPSHPESLGATTSLLQAMILDLYDPDRSQGPRERGAARTWTDATSALKSLGERLRASGGQSLAVITEAHRSPSLAAALRDLRAAFPRAMVVRYEPFDRTESLEGAKLAFGKRLESVFDFARAKRVLVLDGDPLGTEGSPVRNARAWAKGRSTDAEVGNRLYVVESTFSITGGSADHRLRCASGEIAAVLAAMVLAGAEVNAWKLPSDGSAALEGVAAHAPADERWRRQIHAIARDIGKHPGESLVVVGHRQPAAVHALAHYLNDALGNVGTTVHLVQPFDEGAEGASAVADVVRGIEQGTIQNVLLLGTNPAFDAPGDLAFQKALERVPVSIHLSAYVDETSSAAVWHLNRAHPLESWGDVVAEDGTASLVQPLIAPLYGGRTDAQVVRMLLGQERSAHDIVRETWMARLGSLDFEKRWLRWLHDGLVEGSAYARASVQLQPASMTAALARVPAPSKGYELVFLPDSHAYDGRFANNGWLQELPDPFTKLTWGNAACVSAVAARQLGVSDGDHISLGVAGASIQLPVIVAPGQADRTIAVMVGQGRRFAGRVAQGVGVDAYPLRRVASLHLARDISVERAAGRSVLARTQEHFVMEGRPLAREGTTAEYAKDPAFAKNMVEHPPLVGLWKAPVSYEEGHQWGMTIDLTKCIGCNACVVACQSENNIPVVGAERVARSREMHWIRIDRYYEGPVEAPSTIVQPVTCQQCENAPCESVCPVGATTHSPEGLNDMAYNRCVGTRYCANNCPYKVRRFNFFEYAKALPDTRKMQFNPDVTVRSRGVMEKCTFCVQRINHAKIEAKERGATRIEDGRIATACEQACPTRAIIFGDRNDRTSRVAKSAGDPRAYHMLEELNVRPRLAYLAKIRNPNPELES